uniref:PlsC domain-containing protein n=1 Tax=Steinernema glaseri TaxID=37863 RepID=A0A1I7Z831_9BILA
MALDPHQCERSAGGGLPPIVRGVAFAVIVLSTAFLGPTTWILPFLPMLFLSHSWWRITIDRFVGSWFIFITRVLELCFGLKVTVAGDRIEHGKPGLIIMNHPTGLDWLFFWNALLQMDWRLLTTLKVVLKEVIKKVPGAGWGMQLNTLLFLNRRMEEDRKRIKDMVEYWARTENNYQVLMYPEGTTICEDTLQKSRKWGEKHGLPKFDHVLHPRVNGFVLMVQKMRQLKSIDYIYDVTLAYNDVVMESELEIFKGNSPKDIRYYVEKFRIGDLPKDDKGLADWLNERWRLKEERLRAFHDQPKDTRQLSNGKDVETFKYSDKVQEIRSTWTTIWFFFLAASIYAITCYPRAMLLHLAVSSAVFLAALRYYGGFDKLQVEVRKWQLSKPKTQ